MSPSKVDSLQPPAKSQMLKNARQILQLTEQIVDYLEKSGQNEPDFSPNSSTIAPADEYDSMRIPLTAAAQDLLSLVNGPMNVVREMCLRHQDLAAHQVALNFGYYKAVPLDGTISASDLAKAVGMDVGRTKMVMKHLASQRYFDEKELDVFQHSALSALIARDDSIHAVLAFELDEMFQAASDVTKCIQNAPFQTDSKNSPFYTKHGNTAYHWYIDNPQKGARFALAMAGSTKMDRQTTELHEQFPWASLKNGKVVDVGGGSGHVSIGLARRFPNLEVVVEDIGDNMLSQARDLAKDLGDRVTFKQHDFFNLQPVEDAGVYFVRQVIHNWSDEESIRIFRALVPALEKSGPDTSLLINDTVLPTFGTKTKYEEHLLRQLDIAMLVLAGAKQRTEEEFLTLLKEADQRFEIVKVHGHGTMGLLEVHLKMQ